MIKLGITQGNPNGIAYELILKTLDESHILDSCIPVVYGSAKAMAYYRKMFEMQSFNFTPIQKASHATAHRVNIVNVTDENGMVEVGKATEESAQAADTAKKMALEDLKTGEIDVLLLAPAAVDPCKTVLSNLNEKKGLKMWISDSLRLAFATNQNTQKEAVSLVSVENLSEKLVALRDTLICDFKVTFPRIAVLSLNAQAADGTFGKEEEEVIRPALQAASDKGVQCFGPYFAETWLTSEHCSKFDAIVAMYSEQVTNLFQSPSYENGAFFLANTASVVTFPDANVDFELAGKNELIPNAFRNALYMSIDIYHNRLEYKEMRQNPLKKQYFERGSDNEKLDLTKDD